MIRVLAGVIGVLFVAFPLLAQERFPKSLGAILMGAMFITYCVGGERVLGKIAPSWVRKIGDKKKR